MSKVQVSLGDPEHGWIALTVRCGGQSFVIEASDVAHSSLSALAQTLLNLLTMQGEQNVTWLCEPAEYDMVFVRSGAAVGMSIMAFPDGGRSKFSRNSVLTAPGDYSDICLPFWRALRGLQGRFTPEELSERWASFPYQELGLLTAALGKGPKLRSA